MVGFSRFCLAVCSMAVLIGVNAGVLSLDECSRLASQGDPEAAYQLGIRYENGDGVRQDRIRALANFRKAADKGHCDACRKLADIYEEGKWVSKNQVQAAKYRAMSVGQSGDVAAASAKERMEKERIDEIEVALDYIIGRNGKVRDAKAGIRLLYAAAKDKPAAQRVFVQRWEKGDLDEGLDTIGDEEWDKILPWFKEHFDSGRHLQGGYLLGLAAYRAKRYDEAAAYWKSSGQAGLAKAWFYLGKLYDPSLELEDGGGPKSIQSERNARLAYEKCLAINSGYENAKYYLGMIRLFGKTEGNFRKALAIFSELIKKKPDEKWYLYDYGLAGVLLEEEEFDKKWPNVKSMLKRYNSGSATYRDERNLRRASEDWKAVKSRCVKYVNSIRKAANMGCDPARKFLDEYK